MKITSAWVWIVGESTQYKGMKLDDIKELCRSKDLVICKKGIMFDFDDYTFHPEIRSIKQYGFIVGTYETSPRIDLVPRGTIIEYGQYIFPQNEQSNERDLCKT